MITVTFNGESYECAVALKGADFIHLLDANDEKVAFFDGVSNFSGFSISGGSWTTPTTPDECYLVTMGEDGILRKGGHKCSDIGNKQDKTNNLTAEAALADGDYFPFYDTSASAHRKTLWSNIKAKLKAYFDTVYALIPLKGESDPTTSTAGVVGQFYTNTTTNMLFQCTAISGSTYTWVSVGGGGGAEIETYSVNVPASSWTYDDTANWYTKEITVSGIAATDNPDVDVDISSKTTSDDVEAALAVWGNIFRVVTMANKIEVYSAQEPETAITVTLRCIR